MAPGDGRHGPGAGVAVDHVGPDADTAGRPDSGETDRAYTGRPGRDDPEAASDEGGWIGGYPIGLEADPLARSADGLTRLAADSVLIEIAGVRHRVPILTMRELLAMTADRVADRRIRMIDSARALDLDDNQIMDRLMGEDEAGGFAHDLVRYVLTVGGTLDVLSRVADRSGPPFDVAAIRGDPRRLTAMAALICGIELEPEPAAETEDEPRSDPPGTGGSNT